MEIYLRYLEKYGSGIYSFEYHDKNGATKRLKSGKTVGIINKQLVKASIIILVMWKIRWCCLN